MPRLVGVRSDQPRRLTAKFDDTPSLNLADYTITRLDGVRASISVSLVFPARGQINSVELALSESMQDDLEYVLAVAGGGSSVISGRTPAQPQSTPTVDVGDPEAEALGIDFALFTDALGPNGDLRRLRGVDSYVHSVTDTFFIEPGEIPHRPAAGVGVQRFVNASTSDLSRAVSGVRQAAMADHRTVKASVSVSQASAGGLSTIDVQLTPAATGVAVPSSRTF